MEDLEYTRPEVVGDGDKTTKNKKPTIIDMGKTGPLSFSQLQELNMLEGLSEENVKFFKDNFSTPISTTPDIPLDINDVVTYKSPLWKEDGSDYWGKSMWDEDRTIPLDQIDQLSDIRANNQPGIVKLAAGLGKMGVLAVTTAVDGILGTVAGIVNMAANASNINSLSEAGEYFVRNPLSEGLQAINEVSESWMPNYYTMNELQNDENGEWYKNVFTANFWGDKFIKNVGFTLGAAASAILTSGAASKVFVNKGLRDAFKGTVYKAAKEGGERVALSNADDVYKAMRNGEKLFTKSGEVIEEGSKLMKDLQKSAEQLKRAEWGLKLAGSVNSAMGEGRIEAIGAVKELQEKEYNNINTWANNAIEGVSMELYNEHPEWFSLVNVGTTDNPRWENQLTSSEGLAEYERRTKYIADKQNALLQQASMKSADIANYVFLSNVALLSFSNFIQFGRAMSGGFTTANNFKNLVKAVTRQEAKKEGGKEVLKETTKRLGEEGVESAVNKGAIRRKIARAVANPFMEGFEEISQASITAGAGLKIGSELNEYARNYHADLLYDSMFADSIDLEAQDYAVSYLNSLLDGAAKTYGKSQSWEEFSIGFLTGMLGIPKVGRRANGKKGLQMSGEFWEGIRDAKRMKQEAQELANAINARINTPEMREYYKGLIRHTKGEKDKLDFLMKDDKFNYENSEFKQLISDALMFDKAGRLEDFYAMIEDYSQLTGNESESLQTIITNSKYTETDADGNPVLDADGKPIEHSMYDGYSIDDMNKELKKRAEKARKGVDFYVKNANNLKALYGDNISKDVLEQMVYGLSQIDNWNDRSRQLMQEISAAIRNDFSAFRDVNNDYPVDEELIQSFSDMEEYFGNTDSDIRRKLKRLIKMGLLKDSKDMEAYLNVLRAKKKKATSVKNERFTAEDLELQKNLKEELHKFTEQLSHIKKERELNLTFALQDTEETNAINMNILDSLLGKMQKGSEFIELLKSDKELAGDFSDIIKEAIAKSGVTNVAEKLTKWEKYLQNFNTVMTAAAEADYTGKKGGKPRTLNAEKAYNKLYELLQEEYNKGYEEAYAKVGSIKEARELAERQYQEEVNRQEEESKKKKNRIKENYSKSVKSLTSKVEAIKKRLRENKNLTEIDFEKYDKIIDDIQKMYVLKADMLDNLMRLSKHPELFTEEALKYMAHMEEVLKKSEALEVVNKLNTKNSIKELEKVLDENELNDSDSLKSFITNNKEELKPEVLDMLNELSKVKEFRKVLADSMQTIMNENSELTEVIIGVLSKIEKIILNDAKDFKTINDKFHADNIDELLGLETDDEKGILKELQKLVEISYDAINAKKKEVEKPIDTPSESSSSESKESESTPKKSPIESATENLPVEPEETDTEEPASTSDDLREYKNKTKQELENIQKNSTDPVEKEIASKILSQKEAEDNGLHPYTRRGSFKSENGNTKFEQPKNIPPNREYNGKDIGNSIAEEPEDALSSMEDETAFTNSGFTLFDLGESKKNVMKKIVPDLPHTKQLQETLNSFNAYSFVDEGFLSEVKVNENTGNIPVYFFTIEGETYESDSSTEPRNQIFTAVKVHNELREKLKERYGDSLKLIEYKYTDKDGNDNTEYYQIIGNLNYKKNLPRLEGEDWDTFTKISDDTSPKRNEKYVLEDALNTINKAIVEASSKGREGLVKRLNILYNQKIYSAIEYEISNRGENRSDSDTLVTFNGSSTVDTKKALNKSLAYSTEIKKIYTGRLVNATKSENADKSESPERSRYDVTSKKGYKLSNGNLMMKKSYNDDSDLTGKEFHLGIYYGNGSLEVPSVDDEKIVNLNSKNDNVNASYIYKNGKPVKINDHSGGSLWMLVKMADGKYYPKSVVMKRFNSDEYPPSMWTEDNPIMNELKEALAVMCDISNGKRKRALAKFKVKEELLFIPSEYDLVFTDGAVTLKNTKSNEAIAQIDLAELYNVASEDKQKAVEGAVNDFLVEINSNPSLNFRFQVFNGSLNSDRTGEYRQKLLDSNVIFTNVPIMSNVNSSVDLYRFSYGNKVLSNPQTPSKKSETKKEKVKSVKEYHSVMYNGVNYAVIISNNNILQVKGIDSETNEVTKEALDKEIIAACKIKYILEEHPNVQDEVQKLEGKDGKTYYRLTYEGYSDYIFTTTSDTTSTIILNPTPEGFKWEDIEPLSDQESKLINFAKELEQKEQTSDEENLIEDDETLPEVLGNLDEDTTDIFKDSFPDTFTVGSPEEAEELLSGKKSNSKTLKEQPETSSTSSKRLTIIRNKMEQKEQQEQKNKTEWSQEQIDKLNSTIKNITDEDMSYVEFIEWFKDNYPDVNDLPKATKGGTPAIVASEADAFIKKLEECVGQA